MTLDQVKTLFEYDTWANNLMFDAVSGLPDSKMREDVSTSHGSLFGTLVHIVAAEDFWLCRWSGQPKTQLFQADEFSGVDELRDRWNQIRTKRDAFVASLSDAKLSEEFTITTTGGRTHSDLYWQMFQHLANHSSYHRGQVVTLLRQLGVEPPSTDLIRFYRMTR